MDIISSALERKERDVRTNPPMIMNVFETANYLHLSKRKVEYLIKSRALASVKIDGSIRVRLFDINQFIENRTRKGVML
tara:strand:+ start:516 stop:752 length:237 start_codon:yes stop_codon:yes gene_type:complete